VGSPYVAAMKAVLLAACPDARLLDVSHAIPPFDVRAGGFVLWAGTRDFAIGSVHLGVVDPGVGSRRRALALELDGSYYVGPDNGLFDFLRRRARSARAVSLSRPTDAAPTFEGRDVFAPAAGRLAAGTALEELGAAAELGIVPQAQPAVVWVDRFGNLVTDLDAPPERLLLNGVPVEVSARTYSEAPEGVPFWYVGSLGLIEIGLREGRADEALGATAGTPLQVG